MSKRKSRCVFHYLLHWIWQIRWNLSKNRIRFKSFRKHFFFFFFFKQNSYRKSNIIFFLYICARLSVISLCNFLKFVVKIQRDLSNSYNSIYKKYIFEFIIYIYFDIIITFSKFKIFIFETNLWTNRYIYIYLLISLKFWFYKILEIIYTIS